MAEKDARAGHRERLRTKFLQHGLEKFTDEEIIELLLTLATPRKDCKQAARAAMKRFKTLRRVLEADLDELRTIKGIGPNNAFGIKFIHQIARKFLRERMIGKQAFHSSDDVLDYLDHSMRSLDHEIFRIFYLGAGDEVINEETVAVGTATEVPVTPQQIVERAVRRGEYHACPQSSRRCGGTFSRRQSDDARGGFYMRDDETEIKGTPCYIPPKLLQLFKRRLHSRV